MIRSALVLALVTATATYAAAGQPPAAPPQTKAAAAPAAKGSRAHSTTAIVNINTASAVEIATLPGIGAKTAARIVEYRQKNGSFKKVEELMNVRGIGEKNFLKLKPLVTVAPPRSAER
jgi:competence protein ComEA